MIKRLFYLITGLYLASCTVGKHNTRNEKALAIHQQYVQTLRDTAIRTSKQTSFVHASTDKLSAINIVPVGTFRYHPDSGYFGQAEAVYIRGFTQSYVETAENEQDISAKSSTYTGFGESQTNLVKEENVRSIERQTLPRASSQHVIIIIFLFAFLFGYWYLHNTK